MKNKFGWEVKKIKDICEKASSNISQNKIQENEGIYPIYGASGLIKYVDFYHQDKEYIGLIKDGAGVGRIQFLPPFSSVIGTLQYILPKNGNSIKYVAYCLRSLKLERFAQGAAIPHIYFRDYGEIGLPVPPLPTQHQIVSELDALSDIISKKKQQLEELDKLAQATFYDMFGDPVTNEKGWEVKKLGDIGSFKNGLNYKSSDVGKEVKILGVSDFKSNLKIDDINQLSYIMVDSEPNDDYYLKENDFVFVRSNGSKELVGRCLLLTNVNQKVTFSGFCIRLRLDYSKLNPIFLLHILTNVHFKNNLVHQGRGANISNVNQQMLSEMSIITPPEVIQNNFSKQIESIESQKSLITQSIAEVQQLFNYTMDKYFN